MISHFFMAWSWSDVNRKMTCSGSPFILHFTQKWSSYKPNRWFHLESKSQSFFFTIMFCSNIVHVYHNLFYHYFYMILFWVSQCAWCVWVYHCAVICPFICLCTQSCTGLYCMCVLRQTVNQWLEVTGGVYRVSWEGDKWGRVFSFVLPLPSCLLSSDTCSQSVQEEAALVG